MTLPGVLMDGARTARLVTLPLIAVTHLIVPSDMALASGARAILMRMEQEDQTDTSRAKELKWRARLLDVERDLSGLEATIAFGFDADEAGESKLYKANATVEASSGTYPAEVRFRSGTGVIFKNQRLEEDVTSTLMNYDYHFQPGYRRKPGLEAYGFAERFSDNFMSIQQRYEIGSGIKLEWHSRRLVGLGADLRREHDDFAKSGTKKSTIASLDSVYKDLGHGLTQRFAQLELGLAFSVFTELERAQIDSPADTIVTTATGLDTLRLSEPVRIPLPAEHQWRGVIRPSIIYRPNKLLEFSGLFYLKYPFSSPHRVNGRLDYRADTYLKVLFKVTSDAPSKGGVGVFWKWEEHYDNTPPRVPPAAIADATSKNLILAETIAARRHRSVHFGVEVKL